MMPIRIIIPGPPVGKQRAKVTTRGKPHGYTPKKTETYEARVYAEGRAAMGVRSPLTCPVAMHVSINKPIPKSMPKWRKNFALSGLVRPAVSPDASNIVKSIEDGLNDVVYEDDCQIVEETIEQWYTERPEVIVTIRMPDCCGPKDAREKVEAMEDKVRGIT